MVGAFENYTTRAILRSDTLDQAIDPSAIYMLSIRCRAIAWPLVFGRPEWLTLVTNYLATRVYKATDTTSRGWYLLRLAQRLCELRAQLRGEDTNLELSLSLEHVVQVDIFKALWLVRSHLLDQIDNGLWEPDEMTSDLLDLAIWLDDLDLIHHLLPIEEAEHQRHPQRASKLEARVLMAAEHNFDTLKFLNARARGPGAKLPPETTLSLLVGGYASNNPSLFHFALGEHNEEDPIPLDGLYSVLQYCPSPRSYLQILRMMQERGEIHFDDVRFAVGHDLDGKYRLARAAVQGHLELVEYFVNGVPPFNHPDRQRGLENETDELERYQLLGRGLVSAVRGGRLPVAEYLLDSGASPNTHLCLNAAIRCGSRELVELLVWFGAAVTRGSPPPISIAVVQEDMDLFRYLLEKRALEGDSGWLGGAWAMRFAKFLGLDSMVAELVRIGISQGAQMEWVPTKEEERELPW